ALPDRLTAGFGGHGTPARRGRRLQRDPGRAAPAARRTRVVRRLASPRAPPPGAALPRAVRRGRLRAQGLPVAYHPAGARAGRTLRYRPRHPATRPPAAPRP